MWTAHNHHKYVRCSHSPEISWLRTLSQRPFLDHMCYVICMYSAHPWISELRTSTLDLWVTHNVKCEHPPEICELRTNQKHVNCSHPPEICELLTSPGNMWIAHIPQKYVNCAQPPEICELLTIIINMCTVHIHQKSVDYAHSPNRCTHTHHRPMVCGHPRDLWFAHILPEKCDLRTFTECLLRAYQQSLHKLKYRAQTAYLGDLLM